MNTTLIIPFPGRIRASDTKILQAPEIVQFSGTDARQPRRQFIITNVSTAGDIKVQNAKGLNLTTVFPRVALTLETSEDLQITTVSATPIQYEVTEIFYDEGTAGSPTDPTSPANSRPGAVQVSYVSSPRSSFFGGGGGGGTRPSR